jgi:hypothetical protein
MGDRTDAVLALAALAVFVGFVVLVDASLSPPFLVLGGLATVTFELLAARAYDSVRRYWERPAVRAASLALAVALAAVGSLVAPEPVLSVCCGAVVTYLVFLTLVRAGLVAPPRTW